MLKLIFCALALGAASIAHADARFDFVDDKTGTLQTRIGVSGERVRIDPAGANGVYVVLDLKTRTLTQINPRARTTTSSTVEEVSQIVASIASASEPTAHPLLQLAMQGLPPDQRQQISEMVAQAKRDEAYPYQRTETVDNAADLPCQVFEQRAPGSAVRRLCVASYPDLKLTPGDERTLKTAVELLRRSGGPWLRISEVPGLPIRFDGAYGAYAGAGHLSTLTRDPIKPEVFNDPPGYRIVSILEMMANSVPVQRR